MTDLLVSASDHSRDRSASARAVMAIGFRHRALIAISIPWTFTAIALTMVLWPWPYRAEMKILVKQDRVDPLVGSEDTQRSLVFQGVSEQDLNSEVELIRSRDVLERVVVSEGLHERPPTWWAGLSARLTGRAAESRDVTFRIAHAASALQEQLSVEPIQKTSLIRVGYDAHDPRVSARVLHSLAELYLAKHVEARRPVGMLDFFEQQTARYRADLDAAKARMAEFSRSKGVVSAPLERDAALQRVTELTRDVSETDTDLAAARERLGILDAQRAQTPARTTTESRDVSARLQELQRSKLLELELERIELTRVFQPNYPSVVEVEQQLATTREAIARAEQAPIREESTDVNPTYEWLTTELAKARSELGALRARRASLEVRLSASRVRALTLDRLALESHEIERDLKTAEENYVAYHRKQEEARISNALDARRIVNVAVADPATVPIGPARPRGLLLLLLAGLAAVVGSLALAFVVDALDPSFRTPDEVYVSLNTPVLASFSWQHSLSTGYVARQVTDGQHD